MRLTKPNPDSKIQVTARDMDQNTSKTHTFYDTSIEEVMDILKSRASDSEAHLGQHLDTTA